MTDCAIYARLSLDRHGNMLGIERQLTEVRELIAARGWTEIKSYEDNDLSATTGVYRPGFEALLKEVRPPVAVVCWHIDRFIRRSVDLERVIALELDVHAARAGQFDLSTPAGRAVAKTVTAWAQYEGEQKSERQRAAHRQRIRRGEGWWMRRPIGYRMDGTLDPDEAPIVRKAYVDVLAGASLSGIVADWNERGFTSTAGNRWRTNSLRKVLLAERNAALLTYNGEEQGPAKWQALVDEETYRAVRSILLDETRLTPGSRKGGGVAARSSLLTGFATCKVCEQTVRSKNQPSGKRVYLCKAGHASAWADWVDERTGWLIVDRFSRPDVAGLLVEPEESVSELLAEVERLRLRGRRYAAMLDVEEIDFEQFGVLNKANKAKLTEAQARLGSAGASGALSSLLGVEDLARHWSDVLSLPQRQSVVTGFYDRIVIRPRGMNRRDMRAGDVEFWPKGATAPVL